MSKKNISDKTKVLRNAKSENAKIFHEIFVFPMKNSRINQMI